MVAHNVSEQSIEQKVGQLFIAGFEGATPTESIRNLITEYNLGGVIYFSRNIDTPDQVTELSTTLQSIATSEKAKGQQPLLIATDQEGGVVSRLDWGSQLPSQMMLGACGDADLATRAGAAVGAELRSLGITMNLAPVLDVNNNPDNPVIGVRSFAEDPDVVSELGTAMALGMQSADVLACGKHFPGHGDTATDSHLGLPVVDHDRQRLDSIEFVPFRAAIEGGIDAIMTTHVAFPAITGSAELPATVSKTVQTGLLREQLGFDGLIVTDCLEMDAIAGDIGVAEGAIQAVEAGCDLVMVSHTPQRQRAAIEAVIEAVRAGRISEARIDRSLERILSYKSQRDVGAPNDIEQSWKDTAAVSSEVADRIARCGVTCVRDDSGLLPFDRSRPVDVVGFPGDRGSNAEDGRYSPTLVYDALSRAGFDVRSRTVSREEASTDAPIDEIDQLLVVTYDARDNDWQAAYVQSLLEDALDPVVLAVRNPYDLMAFPDVGTYLTTYGYSPAALDAVSAALAGDVDPTRVAPVALSEQT
ncbi:beta-N-acetylhexosaminidase [Halorhabdus rudnickae]|uniref:beta-N-acetylhexosaminidase n=1 Tax=Halorhabdus rudnickae TaxID=1775544 RepID=UPI00108249FD|nr:beta-N-acetylhexosaminidase [Halorhabdus rudnickae]